MAVDGVPKRRVADSCVEILDDDAAPADVDGNEQTAFSSLNYVHANYEATLALSASKMKSKVGESSPAQELFRVAPLATSDA